MEHVYEEIASPIKQMRLEDDVCSLQPDSSYPQSSSTPKANHSCPSRTSSGTEDSHPGSCSSQHSNHGRPFGVLVPNNNNQRLVPKSKTKPLKVLQNQGIYLSRWRKTCFKLPLAQNSNLKINDFFLCLAHRIQNNVTMQYFQTKPHLESKNFFA